MKKNNIEDNSVFKEGIFDRLKGRKLLGKTKSGGKVYISTSPRKSSVSYGGKSQDQINKENKQKKVDALRKKSVESGKYDDPWLKSSPASERRAHYQQLKSEQVEMIRYCPKCQKNETRSECSYGPKYWDLFSLPARLGKKYDPNKPHPTNEEKDHEHSMARSEISKIISAAKRLKKKIGKGEGNIEAWVQSKITRAADYIDTAADYIDSGEHKVNESKSFEITSRRPKKISTMTKTDAERHSENAAKLHQKVRASVSLPKLNKESTTIEDANGNTFIEIVDVITNKKSFKEFLELAEDWQKVNRKDKTDGLSQKAVDAYRRENPGSKLKTAVTEKNPGPDRSKRRKSFCARSKGQQDMHNIDCAKDPDKAICKARRRWRC